MKPKICLRFAEKQDCYNLFKWRNDPDTVRNSLSSKKVSYEEHLAWFEKKIKDPLTNIFIIINEDNKEIGMVRFDKNQFQNFADVSINISPDFRGKGYGFIGLSKAIELYFSNFDVPKIEAKIKKDNNSSIKLFSKIGFKLIEEKGDALSFILNKK